MFRDDQINISHFSKEIQWKVRIDWTNWILHRSYVY